ncbi:GPW/gp25 family protein [Paenibacillus sophorae]|uniref:GPW/gp25 family protein n=1 Tax=Paenibacillus sophorae TaxID=1333845 RepID=A0ABX8HN87_9BACL|nr:GPW/gp25 family protein [Paenibacillus sophorae]
MTHTVDMTQPSAINFAPETIADEVAQNIRTILSTPLGSVPMARTVGVDYSALDEPPDIAEARMTSAVITAIVEQDPRALVTDVSFLASAEDAMWGRMRPVVKYVLVEEVGES